MSKRIRGELFENTLLSTFYLQITQKDIVIYIHGLGKIRIEIRKIWLCNGSKTRQNLFDLYITFAAYGRGLTMVKPQSLQLIGELVFGLILVEGIIRAKLFDTGHLINVRNSTQN